ncbi:CCC motif membrane protein [Lacinutrix algicola]|uniref:CCC motif membrane protein n=1 Tax=Lacinutrix algicola TaxID=342954 RepID=UPI0006E2685B|nr:CCC motif membrane protein [Lacinutrix algicola]
MEQQKLPNALISIILGITSFIGCCCTSGFGGIVLSGVALFLAKKDEKKYFENPENYSNYGQVKTAKIIAIIGLILGAITAAAYIYLISTGQLDELRENYMEMLTEMQEAQPTAE